MAPWRLVIRRECHEKVESQSFHRYWTGVRSRFVLVLALGVGLPSGAPFRCKHRIMHRKRGPGQRGPKFSSFGVGRGFAIWGPFPEQAPDSAPETWTWSTRTEIPRFRRWAWVCHIGPFPRAHRTHAPRLTLHAPRLTWWAPTCRPQPRRKPDRVEVPNLCWT